MSDFDVINSADPAAAKAAQDVSTNIGKANTASALELARQKTVAASRAMKFPATAQQKADAMTQPNTGNPKATAVQGPKPTPAPSDLLGLNAQKPTDLMPPGFKNQSAANQIPNTPVYPNAIKAQGANGFTPPTPTTPDDQGAGNSRTTPSNVQAIKGTGMENPSNAGTAIDYNGLSSQTPGAEGGGGVAPKPDNPWDSILGIAKTLGKSVFEILGNTGMIALGQPSITQSRLAREQDRYLQNQRLETEKQLNALQQEMANKRLDATNRLQAKISALQSSLSNADRQALIDQYLREFSINMQNVQTDVGTRTINATATAANGGRSF